MRLALGGQQVPHLEFVSLTDCSLPGCLDTGSSGLGEDKTVLPN